MKPKSKTEKRADWLHQHYAKINASRVKVGINPRGGNNARFCPGMSTGGWGWWVRALRMANIFCENMAYWEGWATTPSTSINAGIAKYISLHAPHDLI